MRQRLAGGWGLALAWACVAACFAAWSPAAHAEDAPKYAATTAGDPKVSVDNLKFMVEPLSKSQLQVEAEAWFELLQDNALKISQVRVGVKQKNEEQAQDEEKQDDAAKKVEDAAEKVGEAGKQAGDAAKKAADAADAVGDDAAKKAADDAAKKADDAIEAAKQATAGKAKEDLLGDLTTLQARQTSLIDRLNVVLDEWERKGGDPKEYRDYITAISGLKVDVTDTSAAWAAISGWLTSEEGGQRWMWNIIAFIFVLIAFSVISRIAAGATRRAVGKSKKMSNLAKEFAVNSVRRSIFFIGLVVAVSMLEVNIGPLMAAIGAAGLVVGLALQGTLSNFASGILLLVYRPYDVGDVIEAGGVLGKVQAMSLMSTTIIAFDNKVNVVPNNSIWNGVITNITGNAVRRVDLVFGIGYDDDIDKAKGILEDILNSHELVLDDPEPMVRLDELADSSVNFIVRPWVKKEDFGTVRWDVITTVKKRFDAEGISIPYPQQDVHMHQVTNG